MKYYIYKYKLPFGREVSAEEMEESGLMYGFGFIEFLALIIENKI